jgi:hypothetical protein
MEKITRADLKRMRGDMLMEAKTRMVKSIVDNVKRSAQNGNASYMHTHVGGALMTLFPDPNELADRLREIFVDVDIEYAEPYISIRWN